MVMTMEVSPQHHAIVLGKGNINLKIIMQRTNTTIIFPDAGDPNIPPIKKGSVTICSNSIHNVYLARYWSVVPYILFKNQHLLFSGSYCSVRFPS